MDDDTVLMARLNAMFTRRDAPPAELVGLAQGLFSVREPDAELAALTADSAVDGLAVAVRGGSTRLLTFECAELAIEIEISDTGRTRRLVGLVIPGGPARLEARQPSCEPRRAEADARGRFAFDNLRPGPFSLTWRREGSRPVVTQWAG